MNFKMNCWEIVSVLLYLHIRSTQQLCLKETIMKNVMENIRLVLSMGIIGAILLYIGTIVFMPDLTIKIFRFQPFIVVTESMEPEINVNDMVISKIFDIDDVKVGDIITFKADIDYNGTEEIVTHYIYSIDTSSDEAVIRTNRHFEDGETVTPDTWLIQESDVIGTYKTHVPYVGFVIGFITSVYGIVIIGLNIAIFLVIKFVNKKDEEQEEITENNEETETSEIIETKE